MSQRLETATGVQAARNAGAKDLYDVAIVGYGPGGEVLASTLGAAGVRVIVVERWPQPYPLPRLTSLDGEACRVVQATGIGIDEAFDDAVDLPQAYFVDAAGDHLMVVNYPGKLGGWPSRVSIFQPDFERAVADKVATMPNVELLRGWEAKAIVQTDEQVALSIEPFSRDGAQSPSEARVIRAKYLVGTDGARSFVRSAMEIPIRDFNLHERWLNFDADILRELPERFKELRIYMDPQRPHMFMPIGKRRLRLEFRVMEGETDEAMVKPEAAWAFLGGEPYGLGEDDIKIMRHVVYHYHTRIISQWRKGRVFLGGDAAHTMPPYMGQGGCSAMRDGRNLGWKLVEVLTGRSDAALLDTYGPEREPHMRTIAMASDRLSRVVNIMDPAHAAKRDAGMRGQKEALPPELPGLVTGVLHHDADGNVANGAGLFTPQGRLHRDGVEALGDEFLGSGFQLWCRKDPANDLSSYARKVLDRLGCTLGVFDDVASRHAFDDTEGVYLSFLDQLDADVALVRPDFYLFGAVKASELNDLISELAERLHSKGLDASAAASVTAMAFTDREGA
ncbi:bifunctional 3-(3-hydroxy-phenyl)propionate/3-hydroxycinnamic acid hydroxylase [Pandoraea fibrosis]|uniref:Bifunctional 3-(3-hydroxy-phenyl)propionate/3-hydroxycinnamic acid hydroxylase n=1 Tax=Pandoraea fibrosis TaxID=1891094 RepID=A0ABX6HVD1_9BURK|nr:bifunctional 3-(3-hydroxy-phenyl)propionate/3-hydroxycinnamic acid hydroxylase [Pandoraea fibrosis]QHE91570.1 bifunctional 3-(3-hydroxy-phenyl)propionate/3-hydroxycinnamic acid hydroxylase [Pandoraea fibrosis]QHF14872.1 bifunctional 3-(3-hydroxy-phenyl)propionate/3-hydroxycinnamic acid hydroxylase [Pandoraea fibrosis]